MGGVLFALLKALPQVLALINHIADYAKSAQDRGIGRDQAVAEALTIAADGIAVSQAVRERARREHASKLGDDAFDPDFQRKG